MFANENQRVSHAGYGVRADLQDMIGDLSNSPEPILIKMFSNDPNVLLAVGAAG